MLSSSWPRRVGREVKRARWSAYRSAILALLATSALGLLPDVSRAACSTGDLNGDGIVDTVKVDFKADPGWGLSRYLVTANDARYEGRGELLYGTYEIVDIDENDRFCEITVPEAGPSADYRTHYLWYDGRDLRYMGSVPGPSPVVDGSGSVLGYRRGTVLHTWFYFAEYRITDSRTIEFVKQDLYPMNSSVILREDLDLFIERSDSAPGVVVRRGEKATVLASDDERWCLLEVKSGTRGWFHCCGSFVGGREADQVFTEGPVSSSEGRSPALRAFKRGVNRIWHRHCW